MKRYRLITIFLVIILLVGCSTNENPDNSKVDTIKESNTKETVVSTTVPSTTKVFDNNSVEVKNNDVIVNEQAKGANGKFYLGMTRQDISAVLDSMNIQDRNEIEITSDKNAWDWGNKVLTAGDFNFTFDEDDRLYTIDIGGNIPTTLGLNIGDSLQNMEKIYGDTYVSYKIDDGNICEYTVNDHYFWIYFRNSKICDWGISKYKFALDDMDFDDIDISDVKADDYYIGEVIDSYYEWFSRAVNFSGEDAEDALSMIKERLYDADGMLSQRIKDWADAERMQIKKMNYQGYSYGDIQNTSDTELYVTADATYEVTKQDNTVKTKDINKTFYLIKLIPLV